MKPRHQQQHHLLLLLAIRTNRLFGDLFHVTQRVLGDKIDSGFSRSNTSIVNINDIITTLMIDECDDLQ